MRTDRHEYQPFLCQPILRKPEIRKHKSAGFVNPGKIVGWIILLILAGEAAAAIVG